MRKRKIIAKRVRMNLIGDSNRKLFLKMSGVTRLLQDGESCNNIKIVAGKNPAAWQNKGRQMIILIYKIVAIIIVVWAIPTAFDPKNRYNEHIKYEPELFEILLQWFLGIWAIGAILLK